MMSRDAHLGRISALLRVSLLRIAALHATSIQLAWHLKNVWWPIYKCIKYFVIKRRQASVHLLWVVGVSSDWLAVRCISKNQTSPSAWSN